MNTARSLVQKLTHCGAALTLTDAGKLHIEAPPGAIQPNLLTDLKAHKPEVLEWLKQAPITIWRWLRRIGATPEEIDHALRLATDPHIRDAYVWEAERYERERQGRQEHGKGSVEQVGERSQEYYRLFTDNLHEPPMRPWWQTERSREPRPKATAFNNHLFACRRCYAPRGRYCSAGAALRGDYYGDWPDGRE